MSPPYNNAYLCLLRSKIQINFEAFVCSRLKTTTLNNSSQSLNPIFRPHSVCMLLDYKVQQTTREQVY